MEKGGRIRIISNKKLLFVIIIALVLFVFIIYLNVILKYKEVKENFECSNNSDCVPVSCCHANSCVPKSQQENCSGVFCTEVCSGPLDCGRRSCGCVNNKCLIINNE